MDWRALRQARQSLGLSVNDLAEILDTNPVTIRKWETPPERKTARAPNPIACQVLRWLKSGELKLDNR
ncbi:MAG: helix-turn-helix transcriptional regulator [Hyphomicrobiales bacterium]|nr:helix-turn-helix transcriptional regulator [Hyphomicrobiales bacterium]